MGMNTVGRLVRSLMRSFTNPNRGDDIAEHDRHLEALGRRSVSGT